MPRACGWYSSGRARLPGCCWPKAAREAKERGASVVAITRYGASALSACADIVLNVPAVESTFRQGATVSRLSQLLVVDALYSSMLIKISNPKELIAASFGKVMEGHSSENIF